MDLSDTVRAIVVDADAPGRLAVRKLHLAPAAPGEATVRVTAISLNRGEVKRALTSMEPGSRPGWDFAGVVVEASSQGGPPAGTRVVGLLPFGAWAERVRVPVQAIAALPDGVTDAQAATLPVAGLTALHALRKGGLLLGRKVLVDGATGGVGHFAVQLAAASGALVHAHVRRESQRPAVAAWCKGGVVVGETLESARPEAPYDLILDSVGGSALGTALTLLRRSGTCVTLGISEGASVTFDSAAFFRTTGVSLYGLIVFDEITRGESAAAGLSVLVGLVERGLLRPRVSVEAPWTDIAAVARRLLDREFDGKAVLHIAPGPAGNGRT
jgi:NADPH2:quinone reductase